MSGEHYMDDIEFAKSWFNFHPDEKFESVYHVKKAAGASMDRALWTTYCRELDNRLRVNKSK